METLYQRLKLSRQATQADIRRAYHKLAMIYHPDRCGANQAKSIHFHHIVTAFEILSDTDKRALYDQGYLNEKGEVVKKSNSSTSQKTDPSKADKKRDFLPLIKAMQSKKGSVLNSPSITKPSKNLLLSFKEAVCGCRKNITLPDGQNMMVTIPAGIKEGQSIRLVKRADQQESTKEREHVIKISIEPHLVFTRKNNDIYMTLDITPYEAMLGVQIDVPTLDGKTSIQLPKKIKDGQMFRLKGRGIKGKEVIGDQLLQIRICLPEIWPVGLKTVMQNWYKKAPYNPRLKLRQLIS